MVRLHAVIREIDEMCFRMRKMMGVLLRFMRILNRSIENVRDCVMKILNTIKED